MSSRENATEDNLGQLKQREGLINLFRLLQFSHVHTEKPEKHKLESFYLFSMVHFEAAVVLHLYSFYSIMQCNTVPQSGINTSQQNLIQII